MNIIKWFKGCMKVKTWCIPSHFTKTPTRTKTSFMGLNLGFILPLTIFSLLGDSGGLGRASFFFLVATPVTLRFLRVSVPQIITARFFVNLESPWVRCSWCHFSSSTQIPPPRCTCRGNMHKMRTIQFAVDGCALVIFWFYEPQPTNPTQILKWLCQLNFMQNISAPDRCKTILELLVRPLYRYQEAKLSPTRNVNKPLAVCNLDYLHCEISTHCHCMLHKPAPITPSRLPA